jgi:hypothetical protein
MASRCLCLILAVIAAATGSGDDRIRVVLDASEADRVLSIVAAHQAGEAVAEADWQALFGTEPYRRLKQREASMRRDFSDEEFKAFVTSDQLAARREVLGSLVADWKRADLVVAARRILAYLPEAAVIHAKVFPVIKPRDNSFVFDTNADPTIFLAVNEQMTTDRFVNTVAHEAHHIGLASTKKQYEARVATLPARPRKAAMWMGAFGEGLAMLAAAGGPDVPPTAAEGPLEQANWSAGMANLDQQFAQLDAFFAQVVDGKLEGEAADRKAAEFYGEIRGPWYFVGYHMAVTIERRFGRAALIECMLDYRQLLVRYNDAAAAINGTGSARLPVWSAAVLAAVSR